VVNASKLHTNLLDEKSITIPSEYEKNQPSKSFVQNLEKLKEELKHYKLK